MVYFFFSICFIITTMATPLLATPLLQLEEEIDTYTDFTVEYFEDQSGSPLAFKEVQKQRFTKISNSFAFSYNTNNFWFRVNVTNNADNPREIYLEFTEIIHKNLDLFTISSSGVTEHQKNGLVIPVEQRSIENSNPTFPILFKPHETKKLYVKLSSIYSVFGSIQFKAPKTFYHHTNLKNQLYMFYTGAIIIIAVYNLFIFFYLKDKVYLYYVLYVFAFVIWFINYKGLLLPYSTIETYDILQITIPIFFTFLILFSQNVLETKKYFIKFHKILNIYIVVLIFSLLWMLVDMHSGFYFMNIISTPLLPFLIFTASWSLIHGRTVAKIYLIALSTYLISMIILIQLALGMLPYNLYFSNAPIIGSFFEIILFSLMLAYRINILRQEKLLTHEKLLQQEETESLRLANMVEIKTSQLDTLNSKLNVELKEKRVLYQELNHRVKNNLLMILSLIQLQISRTLHTETKKELLVTKNRIHSIANLYENFHLHDSDEEVDTIVHFKNIIENIRLYNYDHIKVDYQVNYNLNKNDLLYAGLILNELVTNAFKYAFTTHGTITISLNKRDHQIIMCVEDDGSGFDIQACNSLGLIIVKTLVEDQLYGDLEIESSQKGTTITIVWNENE